MDAEMKRTNQLTSQHAPEHTTADTHSRTRPVVHTCTHAQTQKHIYPACNHADIPADTHLRACTHLHVRTRTHARARARTHACKHKHSYTANLTSSVFSPNSVFEIWPMHCVTVLAILVWQIVSIKPSIGPTIEPSIEPSMEPFSL